MTSFTDVYPSQIRKGYRREIMLMLICAVCYLFGQLLVSEVSWKKRKINVQVIFLVKQKHQD